MIAGGILLFIVAIELFKVSTISTFDQKIKGGRMSHN